LKAKYLCGKPLVVEVHANVYPIDHQYPDKKNKEVIGVKFNRQRLVIKKGIYHFRRKDNKSLRNQVSEEDLQEYPFRKAFQIRQHLIEPQDDLPY
jgi:hypothetical protein